MTTALFMLRCVELGLSIADLDLLTIGSVRKSLSVITTGRDLSSECDCLCCVSGVVFSQEIEAVLIHADTFLLSVYR